MRTRAMVPALLAAGLAAAAVAAGGGLPFDNAGAAFEQALTPREFEFPRDHGAHPTFAHEWWYVTGHLAAPSGERFGFELTFFRVALAPAAATARPDASHWRARL